MQSNDPLIQDILEKIEFRLLKEDVPGTFFDSVDLTNVEAYKALDVANTHIWDRETKIFNFDLLQTPRLSTVPIAYFINRFVQNMPKDQSYLNIGVWCGFSFFAGIIGNEDSRCVGVDNFTDPDPRGTKHIFEHQYKKFITPRSTFFEMDYLDYFNSVHKEPIGVYFYDGDHAYEHQLKALEVADPDIAFGGYILVDDINDEDPYRATMDFVNKRNSEYKIVFDVKTANNAHPTFWNGLLVIKKC